MNLKTIGKKSLIRISLSLLLILLLVIIVIIPKLTKSDLPGPKLIVDDPIVSGNTWSKKITVYNDGIEHYYNIPVSTSIPENLIEVKLYRYLIGSLKEKITDDSNYKFEIKDTDDNGKTDTVSWIVPELSEVAFSVEGKLELKQPETITQQTPIAQEEIESFKIEAASYEPAPVQNPYDCSASNINCTLTTVTIDNGDGSITMINYQKPVNFFNSTLGDWQAINITIIPGSFDGYDYGVEQGYQVYYKSQISAGDSIKYCNEGYCFTTQPSKITYRNSLGSNDDISQLNTSTIGTATDNKFRWNNTFTDSDLEYTYGGGTHKEYMILKQKPRNPAEYLGDISNVTFDVAHYIKFPAGVDMYVNGTIKTDDFKTSERIEFRNESNVTLFYLPKPIAFDSNETTLNSINLVYDVVWDKKYNPSKERLIWFYIQTPYSWLNETAVYPVYIEPSAGIEYNATVDVYHLWNDIDDYYVNATSGIQVTNHFQEYWTKNQICVNFTWGAQNKEYCAEDIDWIWYNTTDGSTFSNLTGTTTVKWVGHEWGIALEYYLTNGSRMIRITPTATNLKNKNYDKIEFIWRVHDIRVNMTYENDMIVLDTGGEEKESYLLNNTSLNLEYNQSSLVERMYDVREKPVGGPSIATIWNESKWVNGVSSEMNYTLRVVHGSEYNAPIDLILDFGSVAPNDVLSTNFLWTDPAVDAGHWLVVYDVTDYCPYSSGKPDCNSTAYKYQTGILIFDESSGANCNSSGANPDPCYDMDFEEGKVYRIEHWGQVDADVDPATFGYDDSTDTLYGYREGWKVRNASASSNDWTSSNGVNLHDVDTNGIVPGNCTVATTSESTGATFTWNDPTGISTCDDTDCSTFFICNSPSSPDTFDVDLGGEAAPCTIVYSAVTKNWYINCDGKPVIDIPLKSSVEVVFNMIMWFDNSSSETLGRSCSDCSTCKPGSNTGCSVVWAEIETIDYQNYWDVFRDRDDYSVGLICNDTGCADNPELEYNMTLNHLGYSVTTGTAPTAGKDVLIALNYSNNLKSYIQNGNGTVIIDAASDDMDTLGYASSDSFVGNRQQFNIIDSQHPIPEAYSGSLTFQLDADDEGIWYVIGFVGRTLGEYIGTTLGIIDADDDDTSSVAVGARVAFAGFKPSIDTGKFLTWDGKELFLRSLHWATGEGLNITQPNNKSAVSLEYSTSLLVNFTVWDIQNNTEITSGITTSMVDVNLSNLDCSVNSVTYDTDHWRADCTTPSSTGTYDLKVGVNLTSISDSNFTDRDVEFRAVTLTTPAYTTEFTAWKITPSSGNITYLQDWQTNCTVNCSGTDNCGTPSNLTIFYNTSSIGWQQVSESSGSGIWANDSFLACSSFNTGEYCTMISNITGNWSDSYNFKCQVLTPQGESTDKNSSIISGNVTAYFYLDVNLTIPDPGYYDSSNPKEVVQYNAFTSNATVRCVSPNSDEGNCASVSGSIRYNDTGTEPNQLINTTEGATPFYIVGGGAVDTLQYKRPVNWTEYENGGSTSFPENIVDKRYNDTSTHGDAVCAPGVNDAHMNYTFDLPDGTTSATIFSMGHGDDSSTGGDAHIYNFSTGLWSLWYSEAMAASPSNSHTKTLTSNAINATGAVIVRFSCQSGAEVGERIYVDDLHITTSGNTYDYWGILSGSTTLNATYYDGSVVCSVAWCTDASEIADSDYEAINQSDDSSAETLSETAIARQTFHFKINESTSNINSIYVRWEGYKLGEPNSRLYIWNSTEWSVLGEYKIITDNDIGLYFELNTSISNYIDSDGYLHLKLNISGGFVAVYTDYIKVDVTLTGGLGNPQSCGSLTDGSSCQLNWTVNATGNINDVYVLDVNFTSDLDSVTENTTDDAYVKIVSAVDETPPTFAYNNSNTTIPGVGEPVLLYANWTDNTNLDWAWLWTNETEGNGKNYTSSDPTGYRPIDINLTVGETWSNFTWQNSSLASGTVIAWKIYANDSSGNENVTGEGTLTVQACSIAIGFSNPLADGITFGSSNPGDSTDATGNNVAGTTDYNITVSVSGCWPNTVNVYLKANSDLINGSYNIPLSNEKFRNSTDPDVPSSLTNISLTTTYTDRKIASELDNENKVHLKYLISIPAGQQAAHYNNTIYIKGARSDLNP